MYISQLSCKDFRNIEGLNIDLKDGINIFYGDNAQGKTNLIEAIYFCATGRSQRTHIDKELIGFGKSDAYVSCLIKDDTSSEKINVHLKKDQKKGIAVNGIPILKLGDLFGVLLVVIFSPEDLALIKQGPAERRKFMDTELCQLSRIYYYELQQYYRILKQRNNLLKRIQKNNKLKESLFVWDTQLVEHGLKIIEFRNEFIEKISVISNNIHTKITNEKETLHIIYKPNVSKSEFKEKLLKHFDRDILLGTTTIGIHKDDILFQINEIDVRVFGSQGQQRTAALSTKLAEIELIKEETDKTPILLLDDVLSELDEKRQFDLLNEIKSLQTIITCTGVEDTIKKIMDKSFIYKVKDGNIRRYTGVLDR